MSRPREILSAEEIGLLTALAQAVPTVGRWIAGLIDGDDIDPSGTRRVRDVLPASGASAKVAEELTT